MNTPKLKLISHHLCPYVQRAAIALDEQGVPFERLNIDLNNKPDWFLKLSPLGKVPILVVDDDTVIFESSVIAQYIDEITGHNLLSSETSEKYRQLAWMEFASQTIAGVGRLYSADTRSSAEEARANLEDKFQRVEQALSDGPWFAGDQFTLVDAAFAPAFRALAVIGDVAGFDVLANTPKVARWQQALSKRPSVIAAVSDDYPERFFTFLAERDSWVGLTAQTQIAAIKAAA